MEIKEKELQIKSLVYTIRGQQVMLDSDLARIYGYDIKRLNEQVQRNKARFPSDFMFRLVKSELENLKSQFATSSTHGGKRKLPYVFSEQGIYMLATVLRGELAEKQSILIMRAFKEMRHYIAENRSLFNNIDLLRLSNDVVENRKDIDEIKVDVNKILDTFLEEDKVKDITILDGHRFEAIEAYTKIYKQANHTIYIVDDYVNLKTLSLLKCKKENVQVILFSDNKGTGKNQLDEQELNTFNNEYPNVLLRANGVSHDHYIILDYEYDTEKIYHCGASSKDAGKKVCGINRVNESYLLHMMVDRLLTMVD